MFSRSEPFAKLGSLSYLWYSATAVATTFVVGAIFSLILGKLLVYCLGSINICPPPPPRNYRASGAIVSYVLQCNMLLVKKL